MTVAALGAALNLKDHETADHCARVSQNSVHLGQLLGLSGFELKNLKWGAYLHDVGKIGIPERILLKHGELTPEERRVVEKHPLMGYTMIRNIEFLGTPRTWCFPTTRGSTASAIPTACGVSHIPLHARIFAVMDSLDAMTLRRARIGRRSRLPLARRNLKLRRGRNSIPTSSTSSCTHPRRPG